MSYKIKTVNASQKLATMISCVVKKKDQSGRDIDTWAIEQRPSGKLFVHTDGQWRKKGYIRCSTEANQNDVINVRFQYWSDCDEEIKSPDDEGIILGRFTELLINHFADLNIKIEIEP